MKLRVAFNDSFAGLVYSAGRRDRDSERDRERQRQRETERDLEGPRET